MGSEELNELFVQAKQQAKATERCSQLAGRATRYDWWRRLCGSATELVAFDEIVRHSYSHQKLARGLRSVPLSHIVGSVGRSRDFTCDFLPRRCVSQQRWARIDQGFATGAALPVVELYQVGAVYFVVDGHHRVSVAHARGFKEIEANVIEIEVPIRLTLEQIRSQQRPSKVDQARAGRINERQSTIRSVIQRWRGWPAINRAQKERRNAYQAEI